MKTFSLPLIIFFIIAVLIGCSAATEKTVTDKKTTETKTEPKIDYTATLTEGIEQYKNRTFDKAKEQLLKITSGKADKPQLVASHKYLGFIFAIEKNSREAKKHFHEAFVIDKNFELDKSEMGNPVWTPSYEEAKKEFAMTQMTGTEFFNLGKQMYAERKYDESLAYFESAASKKDLSTDNRIQSYKLTAFIYSVKKQPDKAKMAFRKAFEINRQFELDKSEYGNPVWTPLYEDVKKEFHK